MARFFILITLFFFTFRVYAQPPEGYYNSTVSLSGKKLQQALHDIIDNHIVIEYGNLYSCFRKTDIKSDSSVWDMYSDIPGGNRPYIYFYGKGFECGNYSKENDCFNREHSFPKSWFNDLSPMNSDLFHLYPTDGYVNNRRANYPFGETKLANWVSLNGSKVGVSSWPGYSGIVFEPLNEYKGDFARTFFYMATRYYGEDQNWVGSDMVMGSQPKPWAREMLLVWHRNDTVDKKEKDRNNEVYKYQGNRNPFIDNPLFAEYIWGRLNFTNEIVADEPDYFILNNPVENVLQIQCNKLINQNRLLSVINVYGASVLQKRVETNPESIDLSQIASGIYWIRINSGNKIFIQKIIKK